MDIQINQLPEAAKYYPRPRVPMLPLFEPETLTLGAQPAQHSRFFESDVLYLPSGRLAIYYALKLLGVSNNDEVLIPAYHCGSMLEPIIYLGARPVFFELDSQLRCTTDDLGPSITAKTKALLLPHFFGFNQDISTFRAFCDHHEIALIEDCAHAFFGTYQNQPLGSFGDFSIASTVKFFPGTEGGILACNRGKHALEKLINRSVSFQQQCKSMLHTLELGAVYGRLGLLGKLLNMRSSNTEPFTPDSVKVVSDQYCTIDKSCLQWFDPRQIGTSATLCTRHLASHSNSRMIAARRRRHFLHYLKRIDQIQGVKPLFTTLPESTVPYVFPLLLDNPATDFPKLKQQGVPIWRWEELAKTDCKVSQDYRLRLIQLPCHQSLTRDELTWIISTLEKTVNRNENNRS
ncbi:DegT/DnrJ/EryC1/StrS aminotransferase family protein [Motiliproteus coralliicola]|uniref:DegT/DnrJ/EryC1/StrS aminotransferase family protein n=1 Tax=Motiliproteus coralliicola TaxID=2283196 RepID=A0A369WT14_9GAMM|nr:DegT/DnrJ/EryC1/StrS family aminotransferase [Motiliproteus coralliicola]RDE24817.1 DegT/DnrJ/EryC1/StrS aminotransferase family protein [Motiliproteus coralliicola]